MIRSNKFAEGWKVKVAQSCPTLCDPMDYIVHGTLQAGILEWVAFPYPGGLPNPGIESRSPTLQVDSLSAEPQGKPLLKHRGGKLELPSPRWVVRLLMEKGEHMRQSIWWVQIRSSALILGVWNQAGHSCEMPISQGENTVRRLGEVSEPQL